MLGGTPIPNNLTTLRGSSHYTTQVKKPLSKSLLRGKGRSPLKYIMSVLLLGFEYYTEKKYYLSTRVWISILRGLKLLPRGQILGAKSAKRYCHIGTLETFHLWILATSVKAQRFTSYSPPIKLLDFFHLLAKCEDPLMVSPHHHLGPYGGPLPISSIVHCVRRAG